MVTTRCTMKVPTAKMMDRAAYRWWYAEVVREWVANDNVDSATWCANMERWARSRETEAQWKPYTDRVRQMVAVARQYNRPAAVE